MHTHTAAPVVLLGVGHVSQAADKRLLIKDTTAVCSPDPWGGRGVGGDKVEQGSSSLGVDPALKGKGRRCRSTSRGFPASTHTAGGAGGAWPRRNLTGGCSRNLHVPGGQRTDSQQSDPPRLPPNAGTRIQVLRHQRQTQMNRFSVSPLRHRWAHFP